MLNGPDGKFLQVNEIEAKLPDDGYWFIRPVADSKEQAGKVLVAADICETARKVMALDADEIPNRSRRPNTLMMLTQPSRIERVAHLDREWGCHHPPHTRKGSGSHIGTRSTAMLWNSLDFSRAERRLLARLCHGHLPH